MERIVTDTASEKMSSSIRPPFLASVASTNENSPIWARVIPAASA